MLNTPAVFTQFPSTKRLSVSEIVPPDLLMSTLKNSVVPLVSVWFCPPVKVMVDDPSSNAPPLRTKFPLSVNTDVPSWTDPDDCENDDETVTL